MVRGVREDRTREHQMTAYDNFETIVCSCGTSFHGHRNNMESHEVRRHYAGQNVTYAMFAAGDPADAALVRIITRAAV
jgi:hypothetical protein